MTTEIHNRSLTAPVLDVDHRHRIITVIAVPWLQQATIPYKGEVWNEVFERGAFNRAGLTTNPSRVRVNREHNPALAVGKATSFDTNDPRGLIADLHMAKTPLGDETLTLADDQSLSASVGFGIHPGGETRERFTRTRRITNAFLDHIALVQQPAYAGAQVLAVRSRATASSFTLDAWNNDPIVQWSRRHLARSGPAVVLKGHHR